jgi:hypothetical protein
MSTSDEPGGAEEARVTDRRGLLRKGAMAAAGAAGAVILTSSPADAAPGDSLILGQGNAASVQQTGLNSTTDASTFISENLGNTGRAISAQVQGATANAIEARAKSGIAVAGSADDGWGVYGRANNGIGVHGDTNSGIGVFATGSQGRALVVSGRAQFSRSGVVTVAAGADIAVVTGVSLTSDAYVLATLQQNRAGRWVINAEPIPIYAAIAIRLNATVSAATKVAWFVLN